MPRRARKLTGAAPEQPIEVQNDAPSEDKYITAYNGVPVDRQIVALFSLNLASIAEDLDFMSFKTLALLLGGLYEVAQDPERCLYSHESFTVLSDEHQFKLVQAFEASTLFVNGKVPNQAVRDVITAIIRPNASAKEQMAEFLECFKRHNPKDAEYIGCDFDPKSMQWEVCTVLDGTVKMSTCATFFEMRKAVVALSSETSKGTEWKHVLHGLWTTNALGPIYKSFGKPYKSLEFELVYDSMMVSMLQSNMTEPLFLHDRGAVCAVGDAHAQIQALRSTPFYDIPVAKTNISFQYGSVYPAALKEIFATNPGFLAVFGEEKPCCVINQVQNAIKNSYHPIPKDTRVFTLSRTTAYEVVFMCKSIVMHPAQISHAEFEELCKTHGIYPTVSNATLFVSGLVLCTLKEPKHSWVPLHVDENCLKPFKKSIHPDKITRLEYLDCTTSPLTEYLSLTDILCKHIQKLQKEGAVSVIKALSLGYELQEHPSVRALPRGFNLGHVAILRRDFSTGLVHNWQNSHATMKKGMLLHVICRATVQEATCYETQYKISTEYNLKKQQGTCTKYEEVQRTGYGMPKMPPFGGNLNKFSIPMITKESEFHPELLICVGRLTCNFNDFAAPFGLVHVPASWLYALTRAESSSYTKLSRVFDGYIDTRETDQYTTEQALRLAWLMELKRSPRIDGLLKQWAHNCRHSTKQSQSDTFDMHPPWTVLLCERAEEIAKNGFDPNIWCKHTSKKRWTSDHRFFAEHPAVKALPAPFEFGGWAVLRRNFSHGLVYQEPGAAPVMEKGMIVQVISRMTTEEENVHRQQYKLAQTHGAERCAGWIKRTELTAVTKDSEFHPSMLICVGRPQIFHSQYPQYKFSMLHIPCNWLQPIGQQDYNLFNKTFEQVERYNPDVIEQDNLNMQVAMLLFKTQTIVSKSKVVDQWVTNLRRQQEGVEWFYSLVDLQTYTKHNLDQESNIKLNKWIEKNESACQLFEDTYGVSIVPWTFYVKLSGLHQGCKQILNRLSPSQPCTCKTCIKKLRKDDVAYVYSKEDNTLTHNFYCGCEHYVPVTATGFGVKSFPDGTNEFLISYTHAFDVLSESLKVAQQGNDYRQAKHSINREDHYMSFQCTHPGRHNIMAENGGNGNALFQRWKGKSRPYHELTSHNTTHDISMKSMELTQMKFFQNKTNKRIAKIVHHDLIKEHNVGPYDNESCCTHGIPTSSCGIKYAGITGFDSDREYYPPNCNDAQQFLCSQISILKTNVPGKIAQGDNDSFQVELLFNDVLTRAPLADMANCYKDYLQKQKLAEEHLLKGNKKGKKKSQSQRQRAKKQAAKKAADKIHVAEERKETACNKLASAHYKVQVRHAMHQSRCLVRAWQQNKMQVAFMHAYKHMRSQMLKDPYFVPSEAKVIDMQGDDHNHITRNVMFESACLAYKQVPHMWERPLSDIREDLHKQLNSLQQQPPERQGLCSLISDNIPCQDHILLNCKGKDTYHKVNLMECIKHKQHKANQTWPTPQFDNQQAFFTKIWALLQKPDVWDKMQNSVRMEYTPHHIEQLHCLASRLHMERKEYWTKKLGCAHGEAAWPTPQEWEAVEYGVFANADFDRLMAMVKCFGRYLAKDVMNFQLCLLTQWKCNIEPQAAAPEAAPPELAPQSPNQGLQIDTIQWECPITMEIMKDPVVAADGHTYEREAVEEWLQSSQTSPVTNEAMQHTALVPNLLIRSMIQNSGLRTNN